jgi:transcriptional regulator with XRE-family HTH domain
MPILYDDRTRLVKGRFTEGVITLAVHLAHHRQMSKRPHFLKEWRKHKGLSLEQLADRVRELAATRPVSPDFAYPVSVTYATLSRIERFKMAYSQTLMELLAEIYGTTEGSLIMRDPTSPDDPWSIYERLKALEPSQLRVVDATVEALKKTGTEG